MRKKLSKMDGDETKFSGVFVQFGTRKGEIYDHKTFLLRNVRIHKGRYAANHLWCDCNEEIINIDPKPGDYVFFTATVEAYYKGKHNPDDGQIYKPDRKDWRLTPPRNITKKTQEEIINEEMSEIWLLKKKRPKS